MYDDWLINLMLVFFLKKKTYIGSNKPAIHIATFDNLNTMAKCTK